MIERSLQKTVLDSLKTYPVVGILGSRQVGKTTLANAIRKSARPDAVYLDLELPSDMNKLIEIKYSLSPSLSRGFWSAYDDLSCERGFDVYPGFSLAHSSTTFFSVRLFPMRNPSPIFRFSDL